MFLKSSIPSYKVMLGNVTNMKNWSWDVTSYSNAQDLSLLMSRSTQVLIIYPSALSYRQYHQEIEEFVSNLVKRFEEQQKNDVEKTSFSLLPQVF